MQVNDEFNALNEYRYCCADLVAMEVLIITNHDLERGGVTRRKAQSRKHCILDEVMGTTPIHQDQDLLCSHEA